VGLGSGTRSVEGRRPVCLGSRPTGATDATARISGPGASGGIPRHAKPFRGDAGRAASRRRREPPSESPASSPAALPGAAVVPTERPPLGLSDRKQVSCKITLAREFPRNFQGNKYSPVRLLPQADAERQRTTRSGLWHSRRPPAVQVRRSLETARLAPLPILRRKVAPARRARALCGRVPNTPAFAQWGPHSERCFQQPANLTGAR